MVEGICRALELAMLPNIAADGNMVWLRFDLGAGAGEKKVIRLI